MTGIVVALGVLVFFLGVLVVALLKSHAEILRRLDRLGMRLDLPEHESHIDFTPRSNADSVGVADLVGSDPDGNPMTMSMRVGSEPVLLAFLSTSCSSCTPFWERIDDSVLRMAGRHVRAAIVTLGPEEESPTRAAALRTGAADVMMSSSGWSSYAVPGAPYFALVDTKARTVLGEGTATTFEALQQFVVDALNDIDWDRQRSQDRTDADREQIVDDELRRAGLEPNDPRLYHEPGDVNG